MQSFGRLAQRPHKKGKVSDESAVAAAMEVFLAWSGGRADVLLNAAGIPGPLLGETIGELKDKDFDGMTANLVAPGAIASNACASDGPIIDGTAAPLRFSRERQRQAPVRERPARRRLTCRTCPAAPTRV
ncbi:hypothetical protein [Variovorax arabinosiphilus]|uniref:hypothetical protein n=1 Tax=Variovorax arabinosiphilus TaxID=3053498 RepID=UPI002574C24F|nr:MULTISPECIES: hypothetical protein [unclassified Variovorax]MDM0121616.1 hypothetical protein [Variovorax sp. J2L1-78]MDM0234379.1 hypothetical protein [Variovorax sp. J2R1-6]